MVITRIAPSPTGEMHIGTLRTAYFNYLYARANGGKFILRIDDTDENRSEDKHTDYIYNVFNQFGLDYDDTFKQSDRLTRYHEIINTQIANGKFVKNDDGTISYRGRIVVKSSGMPTYHLASVIDDIDYGITHIIRGTDHESNLPHHMDLWRCITTNKMPKVIHLGLIFHNNKKLSKRDGTGSILGYSKYQNDALLNWILKFGWSHTDPNFDKKYPIVTKDNAIKLFMEGNMKKTPSNLDLNKLEFLNKKYNKLYATVQG
jgi:glutamyl-tRNA synthetase